jgi:ergothioneine biosynthesis protein EgtB
MLATQNDVAVRRQLLQRASDARRRSDDLFNILRADAFYERPIPERHRIIFYVGHLEAFDWNLLHENVFGLKSFQPELDHLFAFGIDPVGGGLPADQPSDWPSLDAVRDYVSRIRAALDEKLAEGNLESRSEMRDGFLLDTLLNVAIEHRLMHIETLAYMLHQLPLDRKVPQASQPALATPQVNHRSVNHRMIGIPSGVATLGLERAGEVFGWDNEYEARPLHVPAFEMDQFMVTNRQFLEFIAAGGYETRAFWSDDDWNWKTATSVSHPVFWKKANGEWLYGGMFEEVPLPLDWPCYVSHAEATAYTRWAGKALPTESQWQRAAYGTPDGTENYYPWGNHALSSNFGNFDLERWDPVPVNALPLSQSTFGVHGMLGNGWEWTSTAFAPFPGFEPFPFYRGYSADFFDGKHFVMKGGSARTAACMLRPTFRNWFQAHYQYVYAGFRCVNH